MTQPGVQVDHEIIDLLSDSEDEEPPRETPEFHNGRATLQGLEDWPDFDEILNNADNHFGFNDREPIDLTAIPDIDVPPSDPVVIDGGDPGPSAAFSHWTGKGELVTENECVQLVLNILPDISVDHVLKLIKEHTTDASRTTAQCELLLTQIIDGGTYPKETEEMRNRKRKRADEDDFSDYEKEERDPEVTTYERDALEILKDEFLDVPVRHITNVLHAHKTLFKAYGVLEEQVRNYRKITRPFSKIGKSRPKRGIELIMIERGSQLPKELHAAKRKKETDTAKRHKAEEFEMAEQANLERAQTKNEMGECACCFNDVPLNRMISCNGETVHMYCKECPRRQIETQMGQSHCRPKCFGVDDCNGTFSRAQLQQVLSERTFERLEHMQQQEDLKLAGLDFLSECPFCDFKMECPPIDIDKEFRCENKKCGKTSCRICQKETHIPLTCQEAEDESKKDKQLTLRHIVEEAMSSALIRHCNRCKHAFVKELGCNKMTCTHCRNLQCYVCSKNVTNYQHFGEAHEGKCPLHENVEERHEQDVKRAADEAMAKVRTDNPGLSDADLMIQVSDRVKQAENARRGRAAQDANAFPFQMVGDVQRHRNGHPPMPMAGGHPVGPIAPAIPLPPVPNMQPIQQRAGIQGFGNLIQDLNIQWPGMEALQIRDPPQPRQPGLFDFMGPNPFPGQPAAGIAQRMAQNQQRMEQQFRQNHDAFQQRFDQQFRQNNDALQQLREERQRANQQAYDNMMNNHRAAANPTGAPRARRAQSPPDARRRRQGG